MFTPGFREKVEWDYEYHLQLHGRKTHAYFALVFEIDKWTDDSCIIAMNNDWPLTVD